MRQSNTKPRLIQQHVDTMENALSENEIGIVCFHMIDQPLVTTLCNVVGVLYRALQAQGMTETQIEEFVRHNL